MKQRMVSILIALAAMAACGPKLALYPTTPTPVLSPLPAGFPTPIPASPSADSPTLSSTTGSVSGMVMDATGGWPIFGASVFTDPPTVLPTTGYDGCFLIANVKAGIYAVTASANGYLNTTVTITVVEGQRTIANISLKQAATATPTPTAISVSTPTPTTPPTPLHRLTGRGGGVLAIASSRLGLMILNGDGTQQTLLDQYGVTLSWSPDGQWLAYGVHLENTSGADIYRVKSDGTATFNLTDNPASDREPAWSPDGTQIAFVSDRDGGQDLYVMDADGTRQRRLTTNMKLSTEAGWEEVSPPAWSPDGRKIAFVSGSDSPGIYAVDASSGDLVYLSRDMGGGRDPNWSPDSQKIAFVRDQDIYVMNSDGSEKINLTNNPANDWEPDWSPDGRRIVFSSDRNCCENPTDRISELYVMNADGSGLTRLSRYTGHFGIDLAPDWSPDGKYIACVVSGWEAEKEWFVIHADGSGRTSVYYDGVDFQSPRLAWRPK